MLDYDLEQELSEIPSEYQDLFRQTIEQELADTEQNHTDSDILSYLRQRRDDFKRGGFIRPDGRPGMVTLNPETMYEKALPELARSSLGEADDRDEKRRMLIKIGLLVVVMAAFLIVVIRGRAQRDGEPNVAAEGAPIAEISGEGTPAPTPPLPELSGVDDSLQTIGSLGGALTIGRPSAIELYFSSEETIALAIDPSKPTPKGEMRYSESTMLSDNPVAVWLFGTVLNYGVGIPDSMVRNLEPGDRITLSTDTGASLSFIVTETGTAANYETRRLLSQNRLGLTLFSLPALSETNVSFAIANYDIASEENLEQSLYEIGDTISLNSGGVLSVAAPEFSHTENGSIRIVVDGNIADLPSNQALMLSVAASNEQTTAVQLMPDKEGNWQVIFTLPSSLLPEGGHLSKRQPLVAEFRTLTGGQLTLVQLGEVPHLIGELEVEISETIWDVKQNKIIISISIHNPLSSNVYLHSKFIQIVSKGGDDNEQTGQVTPRLPMLIKPGETVGIELSFLPQQDSFFNKTDVQIGTDLWEVSSLPTVP